MSDIDPAMPPLKQASGVAAPRQGPNTPAAHPEWSQVAKEQHEIYCRASDAWLGDPSHGALHRELGRRERETRPVHLMCSGPGGHEHRPHRSSLSIVLAERDGRILIDVRVAPPGRRSWQRWVGASLPGFEYGSVVAWRCAECGRAHRSTFAALLNAAGLAIDKGQRSRGDFCATTST